MTNNVPNPTVPNPTEHNQWYPFANRPLPPEVDGQAVNPAVIPVFDAVTLPRHARFVVVGAGVHGLSSAYHLAMYLERTGKGSGSEVVLIDKQGPGAGATGLACGCIRNMYMTEPLHSILRASVEVWESDPVNLGFQQVGYVSVGESNQTEDYLKLQASQESQWIPLRRPHRCGGPRLSHQPVARLQDRELRRGAARAPLRVRRHPHGGVGPGPEVPSVGCAAGLRRHRDRLPARHLRLGHRGGHRPGVDHLRAGRSGRRGMDADALGVARRPLSPRCAVPRRPCRNPNGHVDLLAIAGRRGPAASRRGLPHRAAQGLAGCCTSSS